MPSSIPSLMLIECQNEKRVHHTFDLTLAGTGYKFANAPVASESQGLYLPNVKSFGSLKRGTGFPRFGLANPRQTITIYDEDRALQKAIGGPASGSIIGSPASITLRSFNVVVGSHYTKLAGEVKDYSLSGDRTWKFIVGPNTTSLESNLKIPLLGTDDWPTIEDANRDRDGQMIWGEFVSTSRSATGLIQTYMVDETNQDWYVCFGHLPDGSLTTVFLNGVSDTANWTLRRTIVNGRPYTTIHNSGSALTISDNITIDCLGLGTTGVDTGSTERSPAEILQIMLGNIVFGEYPINATVGGTNAGYLWLTDTTNMDDTTFSTADTFLETVLHHEVASVFTSSQTGNALIKQWIDSFKCPVFWSDALKLKIGIFEYFKRNIYPTTVIRQDEQKIFKISSRSLGEDRRNRININYMLNPIANSFDRNFLAADEDVSYTKEEIIQYTLGGPSKVPT